MLYYIESYQENLADGKLTRYIDIVRSDVEIGILGIPEWLLEEIGISSVMNVREFRLATVVDIERYLFSGKVYINVLAY